MQWKFDVDNKKKIVKHKGWEKESFYHFNKMKTKLRGKE